MNSPATTGGSLPLLDLLIATLLVVGATFALLGSIGLARFSDFYKRLHGPTKATTLGVGCTLIASGLFFTQHDGSFSAREVLIAVLLFITAPVSAQILVKSAFNENPKGRPPAPPSVRDFLKIPPEKTHPSK